jgi:hypothetical protein
MIRKKILIFSAPLLTFIVAVTYFFLSRVAYNGSGEVVIAILIVMFLASATPALWLPVCDGWVKKMLIVSVPVFVLITPLVVPVALSKDYASAVSAIPTIYAHIKTSFFPAADAQFSYVLPLSLYAFFMPLLAVYAWFRRPGIITFAMLLWVFWVICGVPGAWVMEWTFMTPECMRLGGTKACEIMGENIHYLWGKAINDPPWAFFIIASLPVWLTFVWPALKSLAAATERSPEKLPLPGISR